MNDKVKEVTSVEGAAGDEGQRERREFLKNAGRAAVAAPAVALLLSAASKQAAATPALSGGSVTITSTTGNSSFTAV